MIRLTHSSFHGKLEWDDVHHANELIIEPPSLFREIASELNHPDNDNGTGICIASSEKGLRFEKNIESIFNPTFLEFNNRQAITTLFKLLVKTSLSEDFYLSTNKFKTKVVKYLNQIICSENYGFEVEADDFSIDKIAKAVNLHIVGDDDDYIELLTDYLEVMTDLGGIKLFIFVNLRSYISENESNRLVKNIFDRQINILFLEDQVRPMLQNCHRLQIDSDFCEL